MTMLASRGQLRASFIRWALVTVPACLLLGYLSGQFGSSESAWFAGLEKPATFPPPATFGIVWSVLYALMGLALALVCAAWGARGRRAAIIAFCVQFAVNLAWSPVFFGMHEIGAALGIVLLLAVLVAATTALFWRVRRLAGVMLLPYLAWVMFAALLNYQFLELNPAADREGAVERVRIGN